jgi:GPH family glycoside/pentoside/hexuronide:cation symporter
VQAPAALTAIRVLIALVPAILLVLACIVAWYYPLTRQRHAEISHELARRRRAKREAG